MKDYKTGATKNGLLFAKPRGQTVSYETNNFQLYNDDGSMNCPTTDQLRMRYLEVRGLVNRSGRAHEQQFVLAFRQIGDSFLCIAPKLSSFRKAYIYDDLNKIALLVDGAVTR